MAEIDEAAAVKLAGYWSEVNARTTSTEGLRNMARAALAWEARAEAAEAERDSLKRQLAQAVKAR